MAPGLPPDAGRRRPTAPGSGEHFGHQAQAPHVDIGGAAMLGEQIAVERIVGVGEECACAAIAALSDVVRLAGNDDAGEAGHAWRGSTNGAIECTVSVIDG